TLSPGDAIILRGANGAGKTTLLRILAGLAAPEAGPIEFATDVALPDPVTAADACVFVGHLNATKAAESVSQNLAFWSALYGNPLKDFDVVKQRLHLMELSDRPAAALSAGQHRRLGVARALVSRRPIWLLDEPTASMDIDSAQLVAEVIDQHCEQGGSVIVATHEPLDLANAKAFRMRAA
ncbi:MAG: heme ABC exporter ATP-binding protein CcmA, partial [Pseudomonadota bacterium]